MKPAPAFPSTHRKIGKPAAFWLFRPTILVVLSATLLVIFAAIILAMMLGSFPTSVGTIFTWIANPGHDDLMGFILGNVRLPRILLALLVGAMLGMAGAAMQSVTRNGLADPGLIGVKEGTIVAILAMLLFAPHVSPFWRTLVGLAGGAGVALVIMAIARSLSGLRFILIGIGVSWLLSSAIAIFMTMARISEVQTAMIWLGGSLHAASWMDIRLSLPWGLAGALALLVTARAADAAMLGDMTATGLGVNLRLLNAVRLAAPVLITAACASAVGGLAFIGLIAPHLVRLCLGSQQLPLLLGSASFGAILVLVADTVGRTVFAPVQIPAGIVLAILGTPFFLMLLWQKRHEI